MHILLVDDHADTTRMVAWFLGRDGHRVTEANDYAGGLAAARSARFDLLVCDLSLGGRDGCDLLAEVRALYPVPALALSGATSPDDLRRTRLAGFDEHLAKPLDLDALRDAVSRCVRPDGPPAAGPYSGAAPARG